MASPRKSLTRAERRRLREIEATLTAEDPELADSLGAMDGHGDGDGDRDGDKLLIAWAVAAAIGCVTIVIGLIVSAPWVGITGFAVTVAASSHLLVQRRLLDRLAKVLGLLDRRSSSSDSRSDR